MAQALEDNKEVFCITQNLEEISNKRNFLMSNYKGIWVYVHHNLLTNNYGLEIKNDFGGNLPPEKLSSMLDLIETPEVEG